MGKVHFCGSLFKEKSQLTETAGRFGMLQACCGRLAEEANAGEIKDA